MPSLLHGAAAARAEPEGDDDLAGPSSKRRFGVDGRLTTPSSAARCLPLIGSASVHGLGGAGSGLDSSLGAAPAQSLPPSTTGTEESSPDGVLALAAGARRAVDEVPSAAMMK